MPSGGYRQPSQPAAVSGPGALSQRTDGQAPMAMTGGDYGDNQDMATLQQGSPLAKAQPMPSGGAVGPSGGSPLVGLGDPTQEPGTPVTAGAAAGAGPGVSALGLPQTPVEVNKQDAQALAKNLPALVWAAQQDDATPAFRNYVRTLIANS